MSCMLQCCILVLYKRSLLLPSFHSLQVLVCMFKYLMILNKLHNDCVKEKKCLSKITQLSNLNITNAVQYEPQNCQTRGTQCALNVQSRGIQCSLENLFEQKHKSSGTQCNFYQHVSKAIQCSFGRRSSSCELSEVDIWSDNQTKKSKCTANCSIHEVCLLQGDCDDSKSDPVLCSKEPIEERQENNCSILSMRTPEWKSKSTCQQNRNRILDDSCNCGQSIRGPSCAAKEVHQSAQEGSSQMCWSTRLMSVTRNVGDREQVQERCFSGVEKHTHNERGDGDGDARAKWGEKRRRGTCTSSSTSGVAEMCDSRSGFSEFMEEDVTGVKTRNKGVKRKKKLLWTRSHDTSSISVCDEPLDFSSLIPKKKMYFPHVEAKNSNAVFTLLCRRKYTNEEQLLIIKYIAENNLYNQVGGVSIWQGMATEVRINRTWQSLKEHFRKQILPNIKKYRLSSTVEELFCKIKMK